MDDGLVGDKKGMGGKRKTKNLAHPFKFGDLGFHT